MSWATLPFVDRWWFHQRRSFRCCLRRHFFAAESPPWAPIRCRRRSFLWRRLGQGAACAFYLIPLGSRSNPWSIWQYPWEDGSWWRWFSFHECYQSITGEISGHSCLQGRKLTWANFGFGHGTIMAKLGKMVLKTANWDPMVPWWKIKANRRFRREADLILQVVLMIFRYRASSYGIVEKEMRFIYVLGIFMITTIKSNDISDEKMD